MDDVCTRIRRIIDELNILQNELEWSSIEGEERQALVLEQLLSAGLVPEFKAAVDRMRHFLWCYIEAASHNGGRCDINYALQSHRLQRVTEMLRLLRCNGVPELSSLPEGRTFFEHMTSVVDEYKLSQAASPKAKTKAA